MFFKTFNKYLSCVFPLKKLGLKSVQTNKDNYPIKYDNVGKNYFDYI